MPPQMPTELYPAPVLGVQTRHAGQRALLIGLAMLPGGLVVRRGLPPVIWETGTRKEAATLVARRVGVLCSCSLLLDYPNGVPNNMLLKRSFLLGAESPRRRYDLHRQEHPPRLVFNAARECTHARTVVEPGGTQKDAGHVRGTRGGDGHAAGAQQQPLHPGRPWQLLRLLVWSLGPSGTSRAAVTTATTTGANRPTPS